ncbi:hypothetical protein P8452_26668 [Trifolium repens]|nr:hypothetical protein P8452_26668 [Trifolium repens]
MPFDHHTLQTIAFHFGFITHRDYIFLCNSSIRSSILFDSVSYLETEKALDANFDFSKWFESMFSSITYSPSSRWLARSSVIFCSFIPIVVLTAPLPQTLSSVRDPLPLLTVILMAPGMITFMISSHKEFDTIDMYSDIRLADLVKCNMQMQKLFSLERKSQ